MMSIAVALAAARERVPAAEARLLLRHVLGVGAAWLETQRDEPLAADAAAAFHDLVARRAAGEPVAYLLGVREFYGRDFTVTPDVLIPRPETELLVEAGIEKIGAGGTATLLDLGTGSGCIAVTLALELPAARVTAVDISPAALGVARANAARLGARVEFAESAWFSALAGRRFELIVGNPPYVAAGDPHLAQGDLRFEPRGALTDPADAGDGLAAIRRIVAAAPAHLAAGGWLWLEHGYDQAAAVGDLLAAAGFGMIEHRKDLAGVARITGGCLAAVC